MVRGSMFFIFLRGDVQSLRFFNVPPDKMNNMMLADF